MLLGVPITAVIYYIAQKLVAHALKKRGLTQDTESYVNLSRIDKKTNELIYETDIKRKKSMIKREKEFAEESKK